MDVRVLLVPAIRVGPETGEPVRRVFGAPSAPRGWTDMQGAAKVTDKNLAVKRGDTVVLQVGKRKFARVTLA